MTRPALPVALVFLIVALAPETELRAQGGLDHAVPLAPFLNGRLPSSLPGASTGDWTFEDAFPLLRFTDPVQLLPVPFSTRLLVVEKPGRLVVFEDDPASGNAVTLLDFSDRVSSLEDSGLLGAVFHPDFGNASSPNRHDLFLYYRYTPDTSEKDRAYLRLSRFAWDPATNTIDPGSEFILIQQYDRNNWHNGGGLAFGPDGFLYLSFGDEGGIYDQFGSAQRLDRGFFSGVIRIDVTGIPGRSHPIRRQPLDPAAPPAGWPSSYSQGYRIPDDNPWQSPEGDLLEEFWAIGLRSPYRMTLDPASGDFWIGDVGQYHREEINLLSRGANYQWPFLEGDRPTQYARPPEVTGTETPPLFQYPRQEGGCIIGGFVYRGRLHPDLAGAYLYADWSLGAVRALVRNRENQWVSKHLATLPRHGTPPRNGISGFGTNGDGEIFVLSLAGTNLPGGRIHRLVRESTSGQEPPALLSETGAFTNLETLEAAPGLIPYEPIQPLWSDGAEKRRWMAIPNDGVPNSPSERITYSETNEWIFPVGTVLVKHFESDAKRLETRFLVRGGDGGWFGFTYRWTEDQLDAVLLSGEVPVVSSESIGGKSVEWRFPSRSECFSCHTEAAGRVLGIKTRHLNGPFLYPVTGRTANQITTLNHLGFFGPGITDGTLANVLTSANLHDESATLERRARSYLDVNCSHCHRPGGPTPAAFDARLSVAPFFQNLFSVPPLNPLGIDGAALVKPGNPAASILYHRLAAPDDALAMPPLGRSLPHEEAIDLLTRWIASLDPAGGPAGPVTVQGPSDHLPPSGALTSPSGRIIYGPAGIHLRFNEPVTGFTEEDLAVTNGSLSRLSGTNGGYTFTVTPVSPGPLNLSIPSDRLTDLNGNANPAIPELSMEYREPVTLGGWRYDYYESDFQRLPDFSSLVPVESGVATAVDLSRRKRDDHFSLRFYGDLRLDEGGEYEFTLESDEGSRLWIDRNLLIDLDGLHETATRTSRVLLEPGLHRIEVAYFERQGGQTLALTVSGPGIAGPSLPPELMSHRADPGPLAGGDPAIRAFFYPLPATDEGGRHRRAYQPDQWIGRNREQSIGDNVHNLSSRGQSWKTRLSSSGAARFLVTIQNDRTVPDGPLVHSSPLLPGEKRHCRIGKKNVTAALVSGRLQTGILEPGEISGIGVSSRWSNGTIPARTRRISFTASSASPGIGRDRVRAILNPRQAKHP